MATFTYSHSNGNFASVSASDAGFAVRKFEQARRLKLEARYAKDGKGISKIKATVGANGDWVEAMVPASGGDAVPTGRRLSVEVTLYAVRNDWMHNDSVARADSRNGRNGITD